ncbi:MAG TPA: transporter substrate-binding domain-containing protein [Xanthobacteraceae bacterium]|nr:transporter substrate-binding domain-containing protein [Xanthobacteraceae bacterium]
MPATTGCLLALALAGALPAEAQGTLARVRAENTLRCAAEPRPGFADAEEDGRIIGLTVDLCRAVAIAVIGPAARVEVSLVEAETAFDPLRQAAVDLAFLVPAAVVEHRLGPFLIPGPLVFIDPIAAMVPAASDAQSVSDLAGRTVCLMIGSAGQRALEATLDTTRITVSRLAFGEDVEMLDAYNVGQCEAVVDHATRLARMRRTSGINHLRSRILDPPLALTPVFGFTPVSDGAWAALVSWTLQLLITEGERTSPWRATATPSGDMRLGWLTEVQAAVGTYAAMRDRHLGARSPLGLPAWPNAPWPQGLLPRLLFD